MFHDNKDVFVELGVRDNFNIPKLHFASHYLRSIKLFGTTDNFNTQYTERLHIDLAKHAYAATNKKDEFSQMTVWLERREKVHRQDQYIRWQLAGRPHIQRQRWSPPGLALARTLSLAKRPSARVAMDVLARDYGATFFAPALKRYIACANNPTLTRRQLEDHAIYRVRLPFNKVNVWHRLKFKGKDPVTGKWRALDSIHARPSRMDRRRKDTLIPGRFDTALIDLRDGRSRDTGVAGLRVGRIRTVFAIPEAAREGLFPAGFAVPSHLAYVEWFTPFKSRPEPHHLMYKISACEVDGGRLGEVIPVENIRRSVHLLPQFGRSAPADWTSSNVLDRCKTFFVNSFTDKHLYRILY